MNDHVSFAHPQLDLARRTGYSRRRSLHGVVLFHEQDGAVVPTISGLLGLACRSVESHAGQTRLQMVFEEPLRVGFTVAVNLGLSHELAREPVVRLHDIRADRFTLLVEEDDAAVLTALSISISVEGFVEALTPNNRTLDTNSLVQDVHVIHNMLRNEVEYGFISVMASASIKSVDQLDAEKNELRDKLEAASGKGDATKLAGLEAKLARNALLYGAAHFHDEAVAFGEKWGEYYVGAMAEELAGRHIPVATGGGPGLMQAVSEGAGALRLKKEGEPALRAAVVAIDTLFLEDKRFNIREEGSSWATTKIRCNDFALRELALVNYAHVVVVFPGGVGTLWELAEILTKLQTKHSRRRQVKVILYGATFWTPFVQLMDHFRTVGTINNHDDLIWLPGQARPANDAEFLDKYLAEVVDSVDQVFALARAHLLYLRDQNQLGLPAY